MLLASLLRLTRFWNLMIIGWAQYCTVIFLIDDSHFRDVRLLLLVISTAFIAAAGYIINDYYDVKIDLINKPDRVVIGKTISRRLAILFHSGFSLTGIGIGFYLNWRIGIVNFISVFFLWLYSNALKRLPFVGNLTVAMLTGLSIYMVNLLYPPTLVLVAVYALFAFFITLVREIIKDIEDLKGDDTFGCKTLPIVWGIRRTKQFTYALLAIFSIVVVVLHLTVRPLPINYFIGFLFLPMLGLLIWLVRADTRLDFYRLSQFCKILMLLGIVSMAFL